MVVGVETKKNFLFPIIEKIVKRYPKDFLRIRSKTLLECYFSYFHYWSSNFFALFDHSDVKQSKRSLSSCWNDVYIDGPAAARMMMMVNGGIDRMWNSVATKANSNNFVQLWWMLNLIHSKLSSLIYVCYSNCVCASKLMCTVRDLCFFFLRSFAMKRKFVPRIDDIYFYR